MKKAILFFTILFSICFCFALNVQGAVITSSSVSPDSIVNITVSPGGDDDTSVLRKIMTDNSEVPLSLTLSEGEYNLTATLPLYDNTTINATGAVINQTANGKGILINANCLNGLGKPSGKYGSLKNVAVNGGTWVGKSTPDTSKTFKDSGYYVGYSTFLFMHAENIRIENCSFKNNYNGHFIEFAGVNNAVVKNCNMALKGSVYVGEPSNEAIQIDNTYQQSNSPVGSPWDDTPCRNISISGCKIKYARGIGTNRIGNSFYENIKIQSCNITSSNEGINIYDTLGVTIKNCTVKSTGKKDNYTSSGIYIGLDSKVKKIKQCNVTISKNTVIGCHAGIKICVLKNNTKFGTVQVNNNKLYSTKNKNKALVITNKGKQITKLVNKGNILKKK
ncbi:MAG: hypothetical protein ACI4V4_05165 [Eubacterium sp.]